jgi:hypothetical protein
MKAREGDLIQTQDKTIFDVKGLVHPPDRIVAFPRFIPDSYGRRIQKDTFYKKIYALSERYKLLEKKIPQYLVFDPVFGERLCEVPKKDIKYRYTPIERLRELRIRSQLDELEANALHLTEFLQNNSGVPWNKLGISGSLLVKLHTPKSDLDPIVYGENAGRKTYKVLKSVMKDRKHAVKRYTQEELRTLYNFRSQDTEMSFNDFVITERRKVMQGKYKHCDFYIRCVKDWNECEEQYGDIIYKSVGYARIRALIMDDSEAIFTPCCYLIDDVQVLEGCCEGAVTQITSFRGRFCEQAQKGETVVAQGKVEKVQKKTGDAFFRLLLGGKPSDYMILER